MKKKKWLLIPCCLMGLCIVGFAFSGRRPYRELQPSDIISAVVHVSPPGKTIPLTDIPKLTEYLNQVVIYRADSSYTDYAGQAASFTLAMADGSRQEITAYAPFVIINGTGYKAKYAPCEKLNSYANRLLEKAE